MKYVEVLNDIQIDDGNSAESWSLVRYLENIVLPDPSMGAGYKAIRSCAIVGEQFKDAVPGSWVGVEDEHWKMLKNTIENPKGAQFSAASLRQFLPFMESILEAKSEKPMEKNDG